MRRLLRICIRVVLGAVALATLGIAALVFVLPRAVHGQALTVLTGSMSPTVPPGSLVFDRPVDPRTIHKGDVITFAVPAHDGGTGLITHRVIAVKLVPNAHGDFEPTFTTKGDANNAPDTDPVFAKNVRGLVWFHVPHLGSIRDAVHTPHGMAGIGILVLAGYAIWQAAGAMRDRRQASDSTPSAVAVLTELLPAVEQATCLLRSHVSDAKGPEVNGLADSLAELDAVLSRLRQPGADSSEALVKLRREFCAGQPQQETVAVDA